jgi:uncharacterized protein YbaR (Trm112 family)
VHEFLLDWLRCCACGGELRWRVEERGLEIESADARCVACGAAYQVRDGIGAFLAPELQREDLWAQTDSHLVVLAREQPELRTRLVESALAELNPADRMLRALLLESEGDYAGAAEAESQAILGMYTPDYDRCRLSQLRFVVDQLRQATDPVIDLASGRGTLAFELARELDVPVVMTDFSPGVLRHDRERLRTEGLEDRVSLLALDARRTPFRAGAVRHLTTYLGLPNIGEAATVLRELRRIVSGRLLAVSHFYPPEDEAHAKAIADLGLGSTLYEKPTLDEFADTGWYAILDNRMVGAAAPTPASEVIDGLHIDGLPIVETKLTWGVLRAT